ncbi:MAG: acyl--CoA ligase [Planctomycetes bacterium]|nr:acyl--CoA ligase [Planctomycetota bacterium]
MNLVHELLRDNAQRAPDRAAIHDGERTLSLAELDARSDAVAAALQCGGLRRGDRIALFAGNSAEFVVALFAAAKAGGVVVPISPMTKPAKLQNLLGDCSVQALVASSAVAGAVAAVAGRVPSLTQVLWTDEPPPAAPAGLLLPAIAAGPRAAPVDPGLIDHDLAAIVYTSGTTATPKGVMLTHRNFTNTSWAIAHYLQNTAADVVLCALPLVHIYGLFQVLVGARIGHAVVLEPSFAYPFDVLRRVAQHRVTGFPGVPALYGQLLRLDGLEQLDLSSLRYLTNAAGPLPPAQIQRLRAMFPGARFFPMYGLTECTRVCYLDPALLDAKSGSVGKAIPNCEVAVVDDAGNRVGPGVVGELAVRGANVMRGYWRRPEETARAFFTDAATGDRLLRTGDLFRTDAEGFLYFVGRRDDVFKCKGEKVSPAEVENVLCQLPAVAEAGVVGLPAADGDTAVVAVLVLRDGAAPAEAELRRHCRVRLESYAMPKRFLFRASLPRTESGKLDRRELARAVAADWQQVAKVR